MNNSKVQLWQRDYEILKDLRHPHTIFQIARLYFPSVKKASARLKKLRDDGLVLCLHRPSLLERGRQQYVYLLSKKGADIVNENFGMESSSCFAKAKNIEHSLAVSDFRVAVMLAVRSLKNVKVEFMFGNEIVKMMNYGIMPDALMVAMKDNKKLLNFIEIDTGVEPLMSSSGYFIEDKMNKYVAYFDSGYKELSERLQYSFRGFRVLMVVKGEKRLENIRKIAHDLQASFFWFLDFDDMTAEKILGNVWVDSCRKELKIFG